MGVGVLSTGEVKNETRKAKSGNLCSLSAFSPAGEGVRAVLGFAFAGGSLLGVRERSVRVVHDGGQSDVDSEAHRTHLFESIHSGFKSFRHWIVHEQCRYAKEFNFSARRGDSSEMSRMEMDPVGLSGRIQS
jgi:hypothetical protein